MMYVARIIINVARIIIKGSNVSQNHDENILQNHDENIYVYNFMRSRHHYKGLSNGYNQTHCRSKHYILEYIIKSCTSLLPVSDDEQLSSCRVDSR